MKSIKVVSLDVEIIQKLKDSENASGLINELLKQHFSIPQFKDKLKAIEAKKAEAEAKALALNEEANMIKAEAQAMAENAIKAEAEKDNEEIRKEQELKEKALLRAEYEKLCSEGIIDFRKKSFDIWMSER